MNLAVVDYGAGNLRSVAKALEALGNRPRVTSDPEVVLAADAVIMPGQGACDSAMRAMETQELTGAVRQVIQEGRPFFGVCLGLQILFDSSEEGEVRCLGVLPGRVRRLPGGLKVPHMGWNQVRFLAEHPVFHGIPQDSHFYFVHSYYPDPADSGVIAGLTSYGVEFCSAIARGPLVATQFHPEKSGALGLKLYENFLRFAQGERR
ncbi:MAG: imidazole glycerol phosphate synthase subunit HisH [Chloroflexi bacterium]|nr:imidazole glycerol phosphate synthase subunit HisH [Chloroflexota bacterium]